MSIQEHDIYNNPSDNQGSGKDAEEKVERIKKQRRKRGADMANCNHKLTAAVVVHTRGVQDKN